MDELRRYRVGTCFDRIGVPYASRPTSSITTPVRLARLPDRLDDPYGVDEETLFIVDCDRFSTTNPVKIGSPSDLPNSQDRP